MSANTYDLGDLIRVDATFTDPLNDDAPIDPDVVKLSVRTPSGDVTTYTYGDGDTIENDDPGDYHALIDADEDGDWFYRWWSTGDGQAAIEKYFKVRAAQAI